MPPLRIPRANPSASRPLSLVIPRFPQLPPENVNLSTLAGVTTSGGGTVTSVANQGSSGLTWNAPGSNEPPLVTLNGQDAFDLSGNVWASESTLRLISPSEPFTLAGVARTDRQDDLAVTNYLYKICTFRNDTDTNPFVFGFPGQTGFGSYQTFSTGTTTAATLTGVRWTNSQLVQSNRAELAGTFYFVLRKRSGNTIDDYDLRVNGIPMTGSSATLPAGVAATDVNALGQDTPLFLENENDTQQVLLWANERLNDTQVQQLEQQLARRWRLPLWIPNYVNAEWWFEFRRGITESSFFSWRNIAGSSDFVFQNTAGLLPTLTASGVDFDGVNDILTSTSTTYRITSGQPFTLFGKVLLTNFNSPGSGEVPTAFMMRQTANTPVHIGAGEAVEAPDFNPIFTGASDGSVLAIQWSSGTVLPTNDVPTDLPTAWYFVFRRLDTGNTTASYSFRINGTELTPSASAGSIPATTDQHAVGGTGNADAYWDGPIRQVGFLDFAISGNALSELEHYLSIYA